MKPPVCESATIWTLWHTVRPVIPHSFSALQSLPLALLRKVVSWRRRRQEAHFLQNEQFSQVKTLTKHLTRFHQQHFLPSTCFVSYIFFIHFDWLNISYYKSPVGSVCFVSLIKFEPSPWGTPVFCSRPTTSMPDLPNQRPSSVRQTDSCRRYCERKYQRWLDEVSVRETNLQCPVNRTLLENATDFFTLILR